MNLTTAGKAIDQNSCLSDQCKLQQRLSHAVISYKQCYNNQLVIIYLALNAIIL